MHRFGIGCPQPRAATKGVETAAATYPTESPFHSCGERCGVAHSSCKQAVLAERAGPEILIAHRARTLLLSRLVRVRMRGVAGGCGSSDRADCGGPMGRRVGSIAA